MIKAVQITWVMACEHRTWPHLGLPLDPPPSGCGVETTPMHLEAKHAEINSSSDAYHSSSGSEYPVPSKALITSSHIFPRNFVFQPPLTTVQTADCRRSTAETPRGVQPLSAGDAYLPLKWVTFEGIFPNLEYQLGGNFPNLGWKIQGNSLTKVLQQGIFRLDIYITNHDAYNLFISCSWGLFFP